MATDPNDKLAAIRNYLETNPSASPAQMLALFLSDEADGEDGRPPVKSVAMPETWGWEEEGVLVDTEGAMLTLFDADTLEVELDHEADCPQTKIPLACIELLTGRRLGPYARQGHETAIERKLTISELTMLHSIVATGALPSHALLMSILDHAAHDLAEFDDTRVQVDARTALTMVLDLPDDTADEDLVRAAARARLAELAQMRSAGTDPKSWDAVLSKGRRWALDPDGSWMITTADEPAVAIVSEYYDALTHARNVSEGRIRVQGSRRR